jgi:hypothetical protein
MSFLIEESSESPILELHVGSRSSGHEIWVTFPVGTRYVYAVEKSYAKGKHGNTWEQLKDYLIGRECQRIAKDGKTWKKESDVWVESFSL